MRYLLAILAAFAVVSSQVEVTSSEEIDQETRCGASIEADSGSLTVPNSGQTIAPGSICIFTIHLQTTNTFRLNISNLDISSNEQDDDCSEAAVRIYALTNLVPADRRESYTFCNDSPPPPGGSFYLSGNLATVIYQASQNASQNSGFTLNFEGIAFQPIPTRHESSYSSATSGLIRYPVVGEYEPNRVNTWLVKTGDANSDLELDVNIERVDIEECGSSGSDTCLCDALIVYEITNTGILEERARLCGRTEESLLLEKVGPNFIVAFFTDYIQVPGQGTGFQILYAPYNSMTTTPAPSTTTDRPPPSNYSSSCGGILEGIEGFIEYKLNEPYENFERCLWTLRTPFRSSMQFDLLEAGYEHLHDNVQIFSIDANGVNASHLFTNSQAEPYFAISSATAAFVFFQSDDTNTGTGFKLRFRVGYDYDNSHVYHEDQNIVIENRTVATLPESGFIRNKELSTLSVMGQPQYPDSDWSMNVTITAVDLEVDTDGNCVDKIHLYQLINRPFFNHLKRYTPYAGICRLTDLPSEIISGYGVFAILVSGSSNSSKTGLALEAWQDQLILTS